MIRLVATFLLVAGLATAQHSFYPAGQFGLAWPSSVVNTAVDSPSTLPPGFDAAVGAFASATPGTVFSGVTVSNGGGQQDVFVLSLTDTQDTVAFRCSVYADRLRSHHGMPPQFDVLNGTTYAVIYAAPVTTTMATGIGDVLAFGGQPLAPLMTFLIPPSVGFVPTWAEQVEPGGFWEPRAGDTALCLLRKSGPYVFGVDLTGYEVSVQALYAIPDGAGSHWAVLPTYVTVTL